MFTLGYEVNLFLLAKDIKRRLKKLIQEASVVDPNLEKRLIQIDRWVGDIKTGSLTAKRFLILFLEQIIKDAEVWLRVKSLPSQEEQQAALEALNPSLKYWYNNLFPKWLTHDDPKFYIWRKKLMSGKFEEKDAKLIASIIDLIKLRGGTVVKRYVVDLSMSTDIIVSAGQEDSLCVQLTSLNEEFCQEKSDDWEDTLRFWGIEKGLFISYNPGEPNFVNRIANITLYNSNNLKISVYLRFNL